MKPSSLFPQKVRPIDGRFYLFLLVLIAAHCCASIHAQAPLRLDIDLTEKQPRLKWNSLTGGVYHVLSSDSLGAGNWERSATIVSPGAGSEWRDADARNRTRFYRIVQGDAGMRAQLSVVHSSVVSPLILQTLTNGTYTQARSLIQTLAPTGQFRLPLPLPDLDPFPEIVVQDVQIYFDDEHRSMVFWGAAALLNQPVELLVTAFWGTEPGALPRFTLGIKLSQLTLAMLSEGLTGSPLSVLDFKNSVVILAQATGTIDPLQLPGKAFGFYGGEKIEVERGVNFFKEIDLAPLPVFKGLQILGIPETTLALQGIVGVNPNLFFNGIRTLEPALLHFRSFLESTPLPGQPGWVTTTSRRLDLSLLGLGTAGTNSVPKLRSRAQAAASPSQFDVTVTDKLKVKVGNDEIEFETVTDLATLDENATTTLTGKAAIDWDKPLGIEWLSLSEVSIELVLQNGEVTDAKLSGEFEANGITGEASIDVPDAEDEFAEITLSTTNEVSSAQIAEFLRAHVGLNVTTNDLPSDLKIKAVEIVLKTEPKSTFTLTGKIEVLGDLETEIVVTVVERDGEPDLLVSVQPKNLRIRHLIPSLGTNFIGNIELPVGGFTSGQEEKTIPAEELDRPAHEFFERLHGQSDFSVSVKTGVEFDAVLPMSAFPLSVLQSTGLNTNDRVLLGGEVNFTLGLLTANGPINLDRMRLEADLPLSPLPGLPASLQPISILSRKLVLTYEVGVLDLVLESTVTVTIDGKPVTVAFRGSMANTPQGGEIAFVGVMTTEWVHPFGIDWLTMEQVRLRLSGSGAGAQAALSGRFAIGNKSVETDIELGLVGGQPSARLQATLDQLSLTELITWAQQRFGVSPFGNQAPDGLLDLRQLRFEIQSAPSPQFTVSANATVLNGLAANVLFTMVRQNGTNEPVLSIGLDNLSLGNLSSRFSGTLAGDLKFPSTAHTFSRTSLSIPSGDLSGEARAFFQRIYGQLDFNFQTEAGVSFGAQLPLSVLPVQAVSILGMNANDKLKLEGSIGISFGMLSGSASVDLTHLDLKAALPNARPVKLPSWMTADPTVQRTLAFSYRNLPGPENALALRITDVVGVTIDDARRNFVLSTALSSSGELAFEGGMVGSWAKPFGVEWLTLDQVSLAFSTDGIRSEGALKSSFPLGGKKIDLGIAVTGGINGATVELTGRANQLSIDDVVELVRRQVNRPLFPNAPPADFAALNDVSMTIRLGRTRSFTIGAKAQLEGRQTELLWSIEGEAGQEPHILLGMQPMGWTLSGAFPALSNPIVDGLQLPTPTLVFASSQREKQSGEMPEEEKNFYEKVYGPGNFSLNVPSGLGLLGGIPTDSLPADGPLRRLLSVLGMPAENLIVEGSLGNALSLITGGGGGGVDVLKDLSLRVVLPPMRPNGSPAWFRSGELSLKITGAPSVSVVGAVTVEIEGDILTFFIESGISFPGPSLQLVGGLQSGGGWTSPFGVEWLTLNELIVLIGVDATGSAKLGFSGDMIIGQKDIQVTALIALNATGVPTNLILEGSSTEGLALSDITALQAKIASATFPGTPQIPIDRLPDMAMKNILLKFAPRPEPSLGVERGLAFSGDFYMQVQRDGPLQHVAGAAFKVGEGEISASGEMISGGVGPITWEDPFLDILLSREQQYLRVGGYADVQQFLEGDLDLALSKESMNLDLEARILDRWDVRLQGQSEFNFETPNFPINGDMLGEFIGDVTSEVKARFSLAANQGKTAIANAQSQVTETLALKNLKDLELGAKIQTFVEELDLAKRAMDAAKVVRDSALSALNSARASRDRAWNLYVSTPSWQPALKAAYYADYLAKAAIFTTRNAAYQAANASYLIAKAAYDVIPPIEQNPIIVALREELNELAQRLEMRRQQLSAVVLKFQVVIDAVEKGLFSVESASFNTSLRDLIETRKAGMNITLVLSGERRRFTPTWDFNRTVFENLKPVIDQILQERGISLL